MSVPANASHPFDAALDAVAQLPPEDQLALVDIVKHRLAEQGRKQILADIQEAKREFNAGQCRTATVDEIMDEINS
jgi:hypothetical protein